MTTTEDRLEWGHPLLTPEEVEIRVPYYVFPELRQLGLLQRNRNRGMMQLSPMVYELIKPDYVGLMVQSRLVLGKDLSGCTTWLACNCAGCKRERAQILSNLIPDWKQVRDNKRPGLREF